MSHYITDHDRPYAAFFPETRSVMSIADGPYQGTTAVYTEDHYIPLPAGRQVRFTSSASTAYSPYLFTLDQNLKGYNDTGDIPNTLSAWSTGWDKVASIDLPHSTNRSFDDNFNYYGTTLLAGGNETVTELYAVYGRVVQGSSDLVTYLVKFVLKQ